jgi:hypothetical protein
MKINEIDKKRQALIDNMIKDCNDPRFLKQLVEDYVWTFKEDLVEMLYEEQ